MEREDGGVDKIMKTNKKTEEMQQWIEEICPQAINSMRDLLADPATPVPSKVQLIGMILDRAMGKAETPLRVTAEVENRTEAEAKLAELVKEMQGTIEVPEEGKQDE